MKTIKKLSLAVFSASLLFGCASQEREPYVVGVAQIVSHTSLNTIRDSFTKQMEDLGYVEGETIRFEYADASNQQSNLHSIMNQFQQEQSDVIVAIATPTAQAAARVAEKTPVVFSAVSDPIGAKLVDSLEHPSYNITGTCDEVAVDQIFDLALSIDPSIQTIGFLYNAAEANSIANLKKAKVYCEKRGLDLIEQTGKDMTELQTVATQLISKVDILFAPNDNTVASCMPSLSKLCLEQKVPFYTGADSMVMDGGFATVGMDYKDLGKETANMVDQILKGKAVDEIPVKVFDKDLNIYVNQEILDSLELELPEAIQTNKRLVFIGGEEDV